MVTIMTPTYNRGYIIKNLYESLRKQSSKNFEWLVIDDGSQDNTEELFNNYILKQKNDFKIQYYKIKNGGKHRAINYALDKAKGEYFFIVDSDDILTNDSIETILEWFSTIKNKKNYAGVSGLKGYKNTNIMIGKTFQGKYKDCSNLERLNNNIIGDKAEIYYTNILRKYKFPVFENETFLSEMVVWNKIAENGYIIRWFNKIIYKGEYLEDGLTKNMETRFMSSPKGYVLYLKTVIRNNNLINRNKLYSYYLYGIWFDLINKKLTDKNFEEFRNKKLYFYFGYIVFSLNKIRKKIISLTNKREENVL